MEEMTQANASRARQASNSVSQLTDQSNVLMKALHDLEKLVFARKKKASAQGASGTVRAKAELASALPATRNGRPRTPALVR